MMKDYLQNNSTPNSPEAEIAFGSQAGHKILGLERTLNTEDKRVHRVRVLKSGDPEFLDELELYTQQDESAIHLIATAQLMGLMQTMQDIAVTCDVLMYVYVEGKGWRTLLKPKNHKEVCGYLKRYDIDHAIHDPFWGNVIRMAAVANLAMYDRTRDLGILSTTATQFKLKPFSHSERCAYHTEFDNSLMKTNGAFFIQQEKMRKRVLEVGRAKKTNTLAFAHQMRELNDILLGHPSDATNILHILRSNPSEKGFKYDQPQEIFTRLKHRVGWNGGKLSSLRRSRWLKLHRESRVEEESHVLRV